jgi:hypothetical protein
MALQEIRPWIFLLLCVGLAITLGWTLVKRDHLKGTTPLLVAFVVSAFFSDADIFKVFKFSAINGLEAQLQDVVTEGQATIAGLRDVAVAASVAIVGMTGLGSNGGMAMTQPARVRDQNKDKLISILKSLDTSEVQLETVKSADRDSVIQQYEFSITIGIQSAIGERGMQADRDNLKALASANGFFESPDKILQLLAGLSFRDREAEELAKDYESYVANGKQRTPEVWAARDDWFKGR